MGSGVFSRGGGGGVALCLATTHSGEGSTLMYRVVAEQAMGGAWVTSGLLSCFESVRGDSIFPTLSAFPIGSNLTAELRLLRETFLLMFRASSLNFCPTIIS